MAGKSRSVTVELAALAAARGLDDGRWAVTAGSPESEPLFGTVHEMEFLERLAPDLRTGTVVSYATELLRAARGAVETATGGSGRLIFCCLEIDGFDLVESGEALVPFVSMLVIPDWQVGLEPPMKAPAGDWSRLVATQLEKVGASPDYHVAEGGDSLDPIVFIGLEDAQCRSFRSVRGAMGV